MCVYMKINDILKPSICDQLLLKSGLVITKRKNYRLVFIWKKNISYINWNNVLFNVL